MPDVKRTEWYGHDPRESIDKRDRVVIIIPALGAFTAEVETKNGWDIFLHNCHLRHVPANAPWPFHWRWCFAPW